MKKKSTIWGIILIVAAVFYLLGKMGILFHGLSAIRILFSVIFLYGIVQGIVHRNFLEITVSLAFLGWMYDYILHITRITPGPLLIAAVLIGLGLDMIFKNAWNKPLEEHRKNFQFHNSNIDNIDDGDCIRVENNFSAVNKYINSVHFQRADIENNFGKCNVYFNNVILGSKQPEVYAENAFGEMNLYFPGTWRVTVKQDAVFGNIKYHGIGSSDPDSPCVYVNAECNFGHINICFE